jgi:hypothetical protein
VILVGDRIIGSTLVAAQLPWQERVQWEQVLGEGPGPRVLRIADQSYAAMPILLGGGDPPNLLAVLLKSRDLALAPYRRIQFGLLALVPRSPER